MALSFSDFGKLCSLNNTNSSFPDPPYLSCTAGFSCRWCVSSRCMDQEGYGQCLFCYLGEYCPTGSINEYNYIGASICPPGSFCANSTVKEQCQEGYFCPGSVFTYLDELRCQDDYGIYCPPGSKNNYTGCPPGHYCPTASTIHKCPRRHFCREFSVSPRPCPLSSVCPPESEVPLLSLSGVLVALTLLVFMGASVALMHWRQAWKRREHARRVQKQIARHRNAQDLTQLLLQGSRDDYGEMMLGMQLCGFKPKVRPLMITFSCMKVEVSSGVLALAGASGTFLHSSVNAIMGTSGSGKSTLVQALLGRYPRKKVSGQIYVNDTEVTSLRKLATFVPQDDILAPNLTVRELLKFSAKMRLPVSMRRDEREMIFDGALKLMGLTQVQDIVVVGPASGGSQCRLSGGQRKRVSIGVELVGDPEMLVLDEPTSGLSSSDSAFIVRALWSLSCLQCTVVAVLHSPPQVVYSLFSSLLLMAQGGRVAYNGTPQLVMRYMLSIGFLRKSETNPADFLLDILDGRLKPSRSQLPAGERYDAATYLPRMWEENSGDVDAAMAVHRNRLNKQATCVDKAMNSPMFTSRRTPNERGLKPDPLMIPNQTFNNSSQDPSPAETTGPSELTFDTAASGFSSLSHKNQKTDASRRSLMSGVAGSTPGATLHSLSDKIPECTVRTSFCVSEESEDAPGATESEQGMARMVERASKSLIVAEVPPSLSTFLDSSLGPPSGDMAPNTKNDLLSFRRPALESPGNRQFRSTLSVNIRTNMDRVSSLVTRATTFFKRDEETQNENATLSPGQVSFSNSRDYIASVFNKEQEDQFNDSLMLFPEESGGLQTSLKFLSFSTIPETHPLSDKSLPHDIASDIITESCKRLEGIEEIGGVEMRHHRVSVAQRFLNSMTKGMNEQWGEIAMTPARTPTKYHNRMAHLPEDATGDGANVLCARSKISIVEIQGMFQANGVTLTKEEAQDVVKEFQDPKPQKVPALTTKERRGSVTGEDKKEEEEEEDEDEEEEDGEEGILLERFVEHVNRMQILHEGIVLKLSLDLSKGKIVVEEGNEVASPQSVLLSGKWEVRRFPGFFVQLRCLTIRCARQYVRRGSGIALDIMILLSGGLVVGVLRSFKQELRDTPSNMCLSSTVLGVLCSVAALGSLGGAEIALQNRELRAGVGGVNVTAYFLSKTLLLGLDNLFFPLFFLSSYYNFVYTNMPFLFFWSRLVLIAWSTSGMGMFASASLAPASALLCAVLLPLVTGVFLGGVDPPMSEMDTGMWVIAQTSFARWSTEYLTTLELSQEPDHDEIRINKIYDYFDYKESNQNLASIMLLILGLLWRLLAYLFLEAKSMKSGVRSFSNVFGSLAKVLFKRSYNEKETEPIDMVL